MAMQKKPTDLLLNLRHPLCCGEVSHFIKPRDNQMGKEVLRCLNDSVSREENVSLPHRQHGWRVVRGQFCRLGKLGHVSLQTHVSEDVPDNRSILRAHFSA